jgi:hypothetical protein
MKIFKVLSLFYYLIIVNGQYPYNDPLDLPNQSQGQPIFDNRGGPVPVQPPRNRYISDAPPQPIGYSFRATWISQGGNFGDGHSGPFGLSGPNLGPSIIGSSDPFIHPGGPGLYGNNICGFISPLYPGDIPVPIPCHNGVSGLLVNRFGPPPPPPPFYPRPYHPPPFEPQSSLPFVPPQNNFSPIRIDKEPPRPPIKSFTTDPNK